MSVFFFIFCNNSRSRVACNCHKILNILWDSIYILVRVFISTLSWAYLVCKMQHYKKKMPLHDKYKRITNFTPFYWYLAKVYYVFLKLEPIFFFKGGECTTLLWVSAIFLNFNFNQLHYKNVQTKLLYSSENSALFFQSHKPIYYKSLYI